MASNGVIGKDGKIPWHLSSDLKYFKEITEGSSVIMGRKTFESLPKALPNRFNIVLSKSKKLLDYHEDGGPRVAVANSKSSALLMASFNEKIFVIGGEDIYKMFIDEADKIYVSVLPIEFEGDTFFPEIDLKIWKVASSELIRDSMYYKRLVFERKAS